jgi:hypothetical protein
VLNWISFRPTSLRSRASKANKWKLVGPKRRFLIQGDDRTGAIADIVGKLADAKINVIAIDAVSTNGRYGALCWVSPRDVKKAGRLLEAVVTP